MKKNLLVFVLLFLTVTITAAFLWFGFRFLSLKGEELGTYSRLVCGQTYRYTETLENGVVVSYPMEKEYRECLGTR